MFRHTDVDIDVFVADDSYQQSFRVLLLVIIIIKIVIKYIAKRLTHFNDSFEYKLDLHNERLAKKMNE